jgi:hypothetical protein
MKLIAKAAAFTAAAAITATGLVGATGTSASAATPTYSCTITSSDGTSVPFDVPLTLNVPTVTQGSTIPAGTPLSGSASLADMVTKAGSDPSGVIFSLLSSLSSLSSLTATPSAFPVTVAGQQLPVALTQQTLNPSQIAQLFSTQSLPLVGQFTSALPVTLPAGTYDLALPSSFSLDVTGTGTTPLADTVNCSAATAQTAQLTVAKAAPVSPTLKATAKKIKAGHVAKIKVVTTPAQKGKAIAKIGKKKVAKAKLKNGKATLKIKGLKKTTKVKVSVGSLKKVVKVKVKK